MDLVGSVYLSCLACVARLLFSVFELAERGSGYLTTLVFCAVESPDFGER